MTLFDWIFILCCTAILCVAIGILMGIFIMIKPVVPNRVRYKGVQRNGNVERIDEDCGNWAEKLTLYNIDYPTMPDVNYKCPKCDSKILLSAETKKSGSFHCLKCGYTGDRDEFNGIDYHGADGLGLTCNDEEEEQ